MMVVFFIGIGLASVATGFAQTPLQVGIGLFVDRHVRRDLPSGRPRDGDARNGRTPACGSR